MVEGYKGGSQVKGEVKVQRIVLSGGLSAGNPGQPMPKWDQNVKQQQVVLPYSTLKSMGYLT